MMCGHIKPINRMIFVSFPSAATKQLWRLTVSMATEWSHPVGSLRPWPLDVTQHQRPNREGVLMGQKAWVFSPVKRKMRKEEEMKKSKQEEGKGGERLREQETRVRRNTWRMIRKENGKEEESMKKEVGVGARKMRREGRRWEKPWKRTNYFLLGLTALTCTLIRLICLHKSPSKWHRWKKV